jgi:hypothetical protein
MRPTDTQIRDRMFDIVVSIRPFPPDITPEDIFPPERHRMPLLEIFPVSLLMRRRAKTRTKAEATTWKGHEVA